MVVAQLGIVALLSSTALGHPMQPHWNLPAAFVILIGMEVFGVNEVPLLMLIGLVCVGGPIIVAVVGGVLYFLLTAPRRPPEE